MPTGRDLVARAARYRGLPYRLGAEADLRGSRFPTALDCSELVELVCHLEGINAPDGTVNQWPWRKPLSVASAIATPGALLFRYVGPGGGNGLGNHVAFSRGDGWTEEARGRAYGTGSFTAHGRGWTHGGLVPGVDYSKAPPPPPPEVKIMGKIIGNVDVVEHTGDGRIRVAGWGYDPDDPDRSVMVHVYAGGLGPLGVLADIPRSDVNAAVRFLDGSHLKGNHGFDVVITPGALVEVAVFGIDLAGGDDNAHLGTKTIAVPLR
jgi:cell wall-associated NlpC family hydrolase